MFTVGVVQDVDSLNPFIGITVAAYEIFQWQYPPLTMCGREDSPSYRASRSPGRVADKMFWTYKIRPDLKWSDGEPMTAKDAAYTFNRIIDGTFEKTNYGNYVRTSPRPKPPMTPR